MKIILLKSTCMYHAQETNYLHDACTWCILLVTIELHGHLPADLIDVRTATFLWLTSHLRINVSNHNILLPHK